jgi:monovalent cation/hydrogen antiporter
VFTTVAVAGAAHWLMGLAWPVGFVLGAIVSPPDAVAPLSIARRMRIPRRILIILEGEGLANDATALILYQFAVAAVGVHVFSFSHAIGLFGAIVAGEIVWGIGVVAQPLRVRHRERLKHIHYSGDEDQELIQLSDCDDEIELLLIATER